jgi:hypothetical protein
MSDTNAFARADEQNDNLVGDFEVLNALDNGYRENRCDFISPVTFMG